MTNEVTEKKKEPKRFWWLKLDKDFFKSKELKLLKRLENNHELEVIYLKLMLYSLQTDGILFFENVDESFYEDLSLEIDEETDSVEVLCDFLKGRKLLIEHSESEWELVKVKEMTGSETASAKRQRDYRGKNKLLQCNTESLQCNDNALLHHVEQEQD